jgi:hypothetical protein
MMTFGVASEISYIPEVQVGRPDELIRPKYPGESTIRIGHIVRITPFKRNVFVTSTQPRAADFDEFRWLLKLGGSDVWYDKPNPTYLKQWKALEVTGCEPAELFPIHDARPVSLETPKVCASPALTNLLADVEHEYCCHPTESAYSRNCESCRQKCEALSQTPLVYYLVLTTCQASNPFIQGAHFNGRQIYMMVRCGSREAAVQEAFYAAGVNGWNVAFSCVMRCDESFGEACGTLKKVDRVYSLADKKEDENAVRIFY